MYKTLFRHLSAVLARVPSMGYAILFLAMIPLFAALYTMFKGDFYHTTVTFEQPYQELRERVSGQVYNAILASASSASSDKVVRSGGLSVDAEGIIITGVEAVDDGLAVSLVLPVRDERRRKARTAPVTVLFSDVYGLQKEAPEGVVHYYLAVPHGAEEWPIPPSAMFVGDSRYPAKKAAILPVPDALHGDIIAFLDGARGFPSDEENVFPRMLYLSAISITTLGYGDIVPISPSTRTLVSLEAVVGMIIIGLFLNSLSHEKGGKEEAPVRVAPKGRKRETDSELEMNPFGE